MLTAKYYEKNNGYKYVLDTLKEQFGEYASSRNKQSGFEDI